MNIKIKKKHLILTGIILFGIIFYIKHYNIHGNSEIYVSFKLNNLDNEISFNETEIVLERYEKPWYSMWMRFKIAEVSPNQDGIVSFKLRKSKRYGVEIYTNKKETYCGGIEFEADTLSQNQILMIPIKRVKKIEFN